MKNLAIVIPIRKGSSRIKNKYKAKIADTNITLYKFEQIDKLCDMLNIPKENVMVSTDSDEVAQWAKLLNFSIHKRPEYYASAHNATFSELVKLLANEVNESMNGIDHILWTYPVTPLFDEHQYYSAILSYKENVMSSNRNDSLVAVNKLYEYFWFKGDPLNYEANLNHIYSQNLEPLIRVNNACYIAPKLLMMEKEYFIGDNPHFFDTPKILSVDIDTIDDLDLANNIIKSL